MQRARCVQPAHACCELESSSSQTLHSTFADPHTAHLRKRAGAHGHLRLPSSLQAEHTNAAGRLCTASGGTSRACWGSALPPATKADMHLKQLMVVPQVADAHAKARQTEPVRSSGQAQHCICKMAESPARSEAIAGKHHKRFCPVRSMPMQLLPSA